MLYYFSSLSTINEAYGYVWNNVSLALEKIEIPDLFEELANGKRIRNVVKLGGIVHFHRERINSFRAMRYEFAFQSQSSMFIYNPARGLCNIEMDMGRLLMNGKCVSECEDIYAPYLDGFGTPSLAYSRDGYTFDSVDMHFVGKEV